MNAYDKMLNEEIAKAYNMEEKDSVAHIAKTFKTWAKAVVAGKRTKIQKPEWNTAQENRFYTLAVVAELKRKYPGYLTINLSEVPGEVTYRDLAVLEHECAIQMYRVAAPYQLVFLL